MAVGADQKKELQDILRNAPGFTPAQKSALLELLNERKRYGLVWEHKPEDAYETLRTQIPVLTEVPERRIVGTAPDSPDHILIEGDNLHALAALQYTHAGQVDVIYIDPPYNRGKKDFKYNDNYIDKEHEWRHSLWSCFLAKRLPLAKRLLSPRGVIIVHMDENELEALNLLLKEEFQERNCLGTIVWNKKNPKGDPTIVSVMHEYISVFAKDIAEFAQQENVLTRAKPNAHKILAKAKRLFAKIGKRQIPEDVKAVLAPFNLPQTAWLACEVEYTLDLVNSEFQSWLARQDFSGGEKAYKFIDKHGDVYQSVSMAWPNKGNAPTDYWAPLVHPITEKPCPVPARGWRNPPATMQKLLDQELILFGEDHNSQPRRKYLLKENMDENTPSIFEFGGSDDDLLETLGVEFEYPKPVGVAKYCLASILKNPKIILDFFAGSGTTLHATMALNAEDGGKRQCILATNNENGICEQVTYERNKRVIQGYVNATGQTVPGLLNNSLRYYKTTFVDREPTLKNKQALVRQAIDLVCLKEHCYQPHAQFTHDEIRVFENSTRLLMLILNSDVIADAVEFIADQKKPCKVFVFSPGAYAFDEEFEDVRGQVELCALPEAIYSVLRSELPLPPSALAAEAPR